MTCDQVEDLLPDLLDGTVSTDQLDRAVYHIDKCEACTFTKGQFDAMQALYSKHGGLRLPDDARERIRAVLES